MNPLLIAGVSIVNLALLAYTVFFVMLIRKRTIGKLVMGVLITGVLLDLTSTICMILGSSNGPLTLHGFIGYVALLGMMVELFLIARFVRYNGFQVMLSKPVILASKVFYIYWIAAYITGAILVMAE
jgi:hypothetical protein